MFSYGLVYSVDLMKIVLLQTEIKFKRKYLRKIPIRPVFDASGFRMSQKEATATYLRRLGSIFFADKST